MQRPAFWHKKNWVASLLSPLGCLYYALGQLRVKTVTPQSASIPVLCVGNVTAGGAGKTPTVLALLPLLRQLGHTPHVISRGYGGHKRSVPLRVDPSQHTPRETGDEPLLLAEAAPTWVCPNRVASARAAALAGATLVVMDDGFQNPRLRKNLSLLVLNGEYDFGNEQLIPAGPMREPFAAALARADAVVLIGEDLHDYTMRCGNKKIFRARVEPTLSLESYKQQPVIAFAGIGQPEKFFTMLRRHGIHPATTLAYPDHHPYTAAEREELREMQRKSGAALMTTTKDAIKWPADERKNLTIIPITLQFAEPDTVLQWLKEQLGA
jgi:tetraacyldisaccharide 4'-kinase